MNAETVRKWLEASRTKRQLQAALRDVNEEIENLEIGILEMMASDGITQVKMDGSTIFRRKITRAAVDYLPGESTDEGYERTCKALIEAGVPELVKTRFYHQSVSSWLTQGGSRELLEPILRLEDIHELGVQNL